MARQLCFFVVCVSAALAFDIDMKIRRLMPDAKARKSKP
jgi:hypothetical protein